jgi:DNA-binding transcriptional ArsR family regulator
MQTSQTIEIFKALSNETRLRILQILGQGTLGIGLAKGKYQGKLVGFSASHKGGREKPCCCLCVDEVVSCFKLAQSTISHHLDILHRAGLLIRTKEKQWVRYTLNEKTLGDLVAALEARPSKVKKT